MIISKPEMPTKQQRIISKSISISALARDVWGALTIPARMKEWMFDSELSITVGKQAGTEIIINGSLHDEAFQNKGMITIFEPLKVFQYTSLSSLSKLEDKAENYSVLTFKLKEENHQTVLTFTQVNFPGEASFEHSNFYWGSALFMLKKYVEEK